MGRLDGKIGIVTGASSGIGHAVAKALAAEGVVVYMLSRSAESLAAAAKDVPGAICVPTDVTKRESVHAAVAKVMSDSGKIDIAVSCAGVMYFTLMKNKNYDQWEQTIDTNCKAVATSSTSPPTQLGRSFPPSPCTTLPRRLSAPSPRVCVLSAWAPAFA